MLPPMEDGALPAGIHPAPWSEIRNHLGFTAHRCSLLVGAYRALLDLRFAGCHRAWLGGSFVTEKEHPGDFDLIWDTAGVDGTRLHPVLRDVEPPRHAQHARYGGDVLPNLIEGNSGMPFRDFCQQNPITGRQRGIVEIDVAGGL